MMGNWVSRNFGEQIKVEMNKAGQDVARVQFSVPEIAPRKRAVAKTVPGVEQPGAPLDKRPLNASSSVPAQFVTQDEGGATHGHRTDCRKSLGR